MTCPHRIAMPGGQDKQGPPDNYANMCEARRLFALAWWDWVNSDPSPYDVVDELSATVQQVTNLTELAE